MDEFGKSLLAGGRRRHREGEGFEHLLQDFPGRRVVIYHQHPQPLQVRRCIVAAGGDLAADAEGRGEAEGAALPRLAFRLDLAAHHPHQPFADRQPQPGAPNLRVVDVSAWEKDSNSRPFCSALRPMPCP